MGRTFDQLRFLERLGDMTGRTHYAMARDLGITKQNYYAYVSGRNALKVSQILEWREKLGLRWVDLYRLLRDAYR